MAAKTLTPAQAQWMYHRGLAFYEGNYILVTRTSTYEFDTMRQQYEIVLDGLRIKHRAGVRWNGQRFVTCHCDWCTTEWRYTLLEHGDVAP